MLLLWWQLCLQHLACASGLRWAKQWDSVLCGRLVLSTRHQPLVIRDLLFGFQSLRMQYWLGPGHRLSVFIYIYTKNERVFRTCP
jgi:hypothetical protein